MGSVLYCPVLEDWQPFRNQSNRDGLMTESCLKMIDFLVVGSFSEVGVRRARMDGCCKGQALHMDIGSLSENEVIAFVN